MRWLKISLMLVLGALVLFGVWLTVEPRGRPEDYFERKGRLQTVEMGPLVQEAGNFLSQDVQLTSDTGLRVTLKILRPVARPGVRHPLAVMLGGHRTGRDAVRLLGSPGTLAVAALDYPYEGPVRVRGWRQALGVVRPARQALRDTPAAVLLATDWLLEQPWVDPARAEVAGVSLGVPFAAMVGAMEPRFRRVWLIHGGADLELWMRHNLERSIRPAPMRAAATRVIVRTIDASRFEPTHWVAQISPRPTVVIGATQDRRLPRELVEQLAAAAREPKQLHWTEGDHVDRQPETIRHLVEFILAHLEDELPPAEDAG